MEADDLDELAELAHVLEPDAPSLPAVVVPVCDLDAAEAMEPRARFDYYTRMISAVQVAEGDFVVECRKAYLTELERRWRSEVSGTGKRFNVREAEKRLPEAATQLALLYRGHAESGKRLFDEERRSVNATRSLAAEECEVRPSERSWYYRDSYVDSYRTQPAAEKYARVRLELYAAELDAAGVRHETKRHDSNGLPYFVLYAFVEEADVAILKARDGLPLPELVRRSWALGANPRVFWPSLPHGFEQRHGFDQHGRDLPAKSSEPNNEPEPL